MRTFLIGVVLTVLVSLLLKVQGSALVTSVSPLGIIDLEFCNNKYWLAELLSTWNVSVARWQVSLDFLFIFCYGILFYHGCKLVYLRMPKRNKLVVGMLMFCFLPPLLDVLENILLFFTLNWSLLDFTLCVTPVIAAAKFIAAAIVVLYLLVSLPLSYAISKKTAVSK